MNKVVITFTETAKLMDVRIETYQESGTELEKFFTDKISEVIKIMLESSNLKNADSKSDIISQKKNSSKSPKQKIPAWGNSQKKSEKRHSGRNGK